MPDDLLDLEDGAAETPTQRSGPSKLVLIALGVVGAAAGGWLGGPTVAPMLADLTASSGQHGSADEGGHGSGGEAASAEGPLLIGNLVLNPAGSGGTRLLVAALSVEADDDARAALEIRDAEARDLLLTVLSSRTVDELSDVRLREEIREDLRSTLNALLGREGVHRIFLPQFVIQ